jgi:NitT/TauT family transport system ATP-binding protein
MFSAPTAPRPPTTAAIGVGVRLADVRKTFPTGVEAVAGVTLDVPAGQFIALLGPSGCSKSTLLRMVAGLETPTSGTIVVGASAGPADAHAGSERARADPDPSHGAAPQTVALSYAPIWRDAPDPHVAGRSDVAFVFQDPHLLPWRTVLKNAALPLELRGAPRRPRLAAAHEALAQVGLADAVDRYPAQLSGGMRMRVSLARAIVTRPRLLLLDEPFAALDEITRQQLDEQLRALWRQSGMTVLFVTHSIGEAVFLAERAVVFSARPARVVLDRTVDLPVDRDAMIRTRPQFAEQTRDVFAALREASEGV